MAMDFSDAMAELPLVAILRGIRSREAAGIGAALLAAGFRLIEVPLNSPEPLRSIEILADRFGDRALIGAGTVMTPGQAREVVAAGGRLVVMPHADPEVIGAAKAASAWCLPGIATPSEGFAALRAGADGLKLFPAEALPPPFVRALKAVMPGEVPLMPVGGIEPQSLAAYVAAGAAGFGIGSALYKPGVTADEIGRRARTFADTWLALQTGAPHAVAPKLSCKPRRVALFEADSPVFLSFPLYPWLLSVKSMIYCRVSGMPLSAPDSL